MKYLTLTDDQKASMVRSRLAQNESEHYSLTLNAGTQDVDSDQAKSTRERIKQLESEHKYFAEELGKLPTGGEPTQNVPVAPTA